MATIKIDLTELGLFSGLYNSIWDGEMGTPLQEETISVCEDIFEGSSFYTRIKNIENILKDIAELFCNVLENELEGTFEYESYWSPDSYNYDTDHIYLTWNVEDKTEDEMKTLLNDFIEDTKSNDDYELYVIYDYNGEGNNIINNNYDIIMIEDGNEYIVKDVNDDSVELQSI